MNIINQKYRTKFIEKYENQELTKLSKEWESLIYPNCGCVGKIPIKMIQNRKRIKDLEDGMDVILSLIE